jgi:hypothetical protein
MIWDIVGLNPTVITNQSMLAGGLNIFI